MIVKKYLKNLSSDLIEENYKKYSKYFNDFGRAERIRTLKEEQYQEGFLRELFVDCLNYTINPNEDFNLTTEFKNKTDAEKADGAILKDENPIAVIELKSTKTKDLKSIEKQAFNYKAHQTDCKYIITSNFEKIRLYINDATEFEEFEVFQLSENDFKFLYLCFSKESIFEDIPAKMKEKSNQHEEQISKKLYNDYSIFRNNIFQNLTKNNPQIDKLILFKKSQKLLDRFLFIFFAEDKGLIPANIISKVIEDYNKLLELDHYTPLYNEFKRFFSYINKGNEKLSIAAYNGGLFQFDEILDNVIIDDEILINDSLKLSNYDFDSEIDVNILGHIFEHSLTDIEKLNAEISGENLDKKQTRRKKEGVFYTPNYITKYIVENTVGTICNEKKNELKLNNLEIDETYFKKTKNALSQKGDQLFETLEIYKDWLLSLKILDPACGSGAFLNQALNFIIDEHNFIIDLETDLRKGQLSLFDIDTAVLENNLYGVDINEESVEIAKLSLWLKTAKKGRKLTDLSEHIKCGNSLIDDPEIAGEKAFDWNKEFPDIMQNGGFDVVIGNPPYVIISQSELDKYKFVKGNYNTYVAFVEKSILISQTDCKIGLIIPNTWFAGDNYQYFRNILITKYNIQELIQLPYDIFEAYIDTVIIILNKSTENKTTLYYKFNIKNNQKSIDVSLLTPFPNREWIKFNKIFLNEEISYIGDKVWFSKQNVKLGSISKINRGSLPAKIYEKSDIKNDYYNIKWFDDQVFRYVIRKENKKEFYVNYDMLRENKPIYLFKTKKLLARQLMSRNFRMNVTYTDNEFAFKKNLYAIYDLVIDFKYLYVLSILNSKLFSFLQFNFNTSLQRDDFPAFSLKDFRNFPIPRIDMLHQQPFIVKADLMLSLNKQKQEKINKFLHRLETNFDIENFSNKMKAFYNFDFKTLLSELKKKKVKLSFSQQDEFEEYFNNYEVEINELQKQIDKTDKEIDQMVYELYGLTKEEIETVEGNIK